MCGWQYLVAIKIWCSNIKSTSLMLICIKHCDYPASYASVRRMHSMDNIFFRFPEEPFSTETTQRNNLMFLLIRKTISDSKIMQSHPANHFWQTPCHFDTSPFPWTNSLQIANPEWGILQDGPKKKGNKWRY